MAYTTIDKPEDYFNTVLYTGNASSRSISGVGFQPDWTWIKNRSATQHHNLFDAVRGAGKLLYSNLSDAEATSSTHLTSFDSDGFSLGTATSSNGSGNNIVAWNWKANGSGSSNTDGGITSTVSANTTAGFSICSWTHNGGNSTIGHGLGAVPQVVITKERNNSGSWNSYFNAVGNGYRMVLQGTNARISSSVWNSTTPTSSVFSFNDSITSTMIAYCFAEKTGYSKFGGYTGNGNSSGTYIYLGFRPAWLMIKRSNSGTDRWVILDSTRDTFNVSNKAVYADDSQAENPVTSEQGLDILSNGFKIRNTQTKTNTSGATYLYMAFAENPFVTSTGIPTTAR